MFSKEQEYLLVKLMEECSEVQKETAKIFTFGLNNKNPYVPDSLSNLSLLLLELNDLVATIDFMTQYDLLPEDWEKPYLQYEKAKKIRKFMKISLSLKE